MIDSVLPWVAGPFAAWVLHRAYRNGVRCPYHAAFVLLMLALGSVSAFINGHYGPGFLGSASASYVAWLLWNHRRPKRRALRGAGRVIDLGHRLTVVPE